MGIIWSLRKNYKPMKFFLSLLLSSVIFVCSLSQALANDLSVLCADSTCTVSSNAPLFGADINWIPEQVVTKTISVANYDNSLGELNFVVKPTSASPIDEYILLNLEQADQSLWQGTLAQLFAVKKIKLVTLASKQTITLSLTASMDSNAPNQIQSASSAFDFSFALKSLGQSSSSSKSSNSSTNSSSTQESTPQPIAENQSNRSIIAAAATSLLPTRVSQLVPDEPNQVLPAFHAATEADEGKVLGSSLVCNQHPFWWTILILETVALAAVQRLKPSKSKRLLQGAVLVGASLAILALTCSPWFMILVGIPPFLASQVLRTSKRYFRPSAA